MQQRSGTRTQCIRRHATPLYEWTSFQERRSNLLSDTVTFGSVRPGQKHPTLYLQRLLPDLDPRAQLREYSQNRTSDHPGPINVGQGRRQKSSETVVAVRFALARRQQTTLARQYRVP